MQSEGFWNDKNTSESIIEELNNLKNILDKASSLRDNIINNRSMLESLDNNDNDFITLLEEELPNIEKEMSSGSFCWKSSFN